MATWKERATTVYKNVKCHASDCWSSLRNTIRESKTRIHTTHWRRMQNRAIVILRNGLATITEREDGHHSLTKPEITRTTRTYLPKGYKCHHQILEETTQPMDYLRICRAQSLLYPEDLLLLIWSTEGGREGGGGRTLAESERNVDSLSESFNSQDLEQYLVYIIHSPALGTQIKSIPREDPQRSKTVALEVYNRRKNRYKNNLPYDDTRVVLEGNEFEADYINANYIEGTLGPRSFIATQGPMAANAGTIDDFWRMVWQTNTNMIVMLGNLQEGGKVKISQYWPEPCGTEENYGVVKVVNKSVKEDVDWLRRHFLVSKGNHSREIIQYHYTAWPDHDVPESPYGASRMVKDMTKWQWTGPPVIHCSAGLGRTGTLLLVLRLLGDLYQTGHFQPPHILRSLRMCRPNLLDNYFQYRFAHQILLEALYGCKTRFPLDKFSTYIITSKHQFPDQYKELKGVRSRHSYNWAKTQDPNLNRDNNVLPADGRQVVLALNDHDNEYLNAVRVHGPNLRDTFVVTEHPMGHTIIRCWRMAYMCKAAVWIFLHDHPPNSENFPSVLPDADYAKLEDITVQIMGKIDKEFFTETHVTVSQGKLQSHKMLLITFKNWCHTCDLPNPPESLIFLVNHVEEIRRSLVNKVTIVSCSDGYSASGLFVALVRIMTEMQHTQSVDVYRTVQSILFDRPQFIISQNQYLYLHDAIIFRYRYQNTKQRETESKNERPKSYQVYLGTQRTSS